MTNKDHKKLNPFQLTDEELEELKKREREENIKEVAFAFIVIVAVLLALGILMEAVTR